MLATIEFNGCPLAYEIAGQGEPVVFIQGVGVNGSGWLPQVRELARHHRCLTFDNRGIGQSRPAGAPLTVEQMAEDTLAIMDAAGLYAAHMVGHSLGGVVAQQLASGAPSRVLSLALLCTSGRGADALRLAPRLIWLGLRSRVGTRRMRRLAFLQIVMPAAYLAAQDQEELAQKVGVLFGHDLADSPSIAGRQLRALSKFKGHALRARASLPVLVLSAGEDPIFPAQFGRALANSIPGASFVEFPNASHGVILQCATEINQLLLAHFASVAGS